MVMTEDNQFERSSWRVLISPPAPGKWNMAVDEALLESAASKTTLPALRLFAWEPACLSLGYAQFRSDVDDEGLRRNGWDLVRRPTGGRAILHTDELTYSITAPSDEPRVKGSVLESYCRLSKALLAALKIMGIDAIAQGIDPKNSKKYPPGPVCFEEPSNYEITWKGKKLIGSAQARKLNGVLQHGSLPLFGKLERILDGLVLGEDHNREISAKRLLDHALTVEAVLGRKISWEEAAEAFINGFSQALSIDFIKSDLSERELTRASELVDQKYGNPAWIDRV